MTAPKYTSRKNGKEMVTKRITVHLYKEEVEWVAANVGCTEPTAIKLMLEHIENSMHGCSRTWVVDGTGLSYHEPMAWEAEEGKSSIYIGPMGV